MIRAGIDLGAVVCAVFMVARMRRHVTASAMRFGVAAVVVHTAFQLTLLAGPLSSTTEAGEPDLNAAAVVFGFTVLTRGRWERLVPDICLADPGSERNDLQGRVAWVMLPVLGLAVLFHWAAGGL